MSIPHNLNMLTATYTWIIRVYIGSTHVSCCEYGYEQDKLRKKR